MQSLKNLKEKKKKKKKALWQISSFKSLTDKKENHLTNCSAYIVSD